MWSREQSHPGGNRGRARRWWRDSKRRAATPGAVKKCWRCGREPFGAKQIVESASEALGSQIGLLVNTLDPEAVVIGGGLGLSEGSYWEHFIASTRRHIWSNLHRQLPILRAVTGTDAGWIGAAAKAAQQFSQSDEIEPNNHEQNTSSP